VISQHIAGIDKYAFMDCQLLNEVTVQWKEPLIVSNTAFDGLNSAGCTLKVAQGTSSAYQNAPVWKDFGNFIENENGQASVDIPQINNIHITSITELLL
jgi:hypothetical protein